MYNFEQNMINLICKKNCYTIGARSFLLLSVILLLLMPFRLILLLLLFIRLLLPFLDDSLISLVIFSFSVCSAFWACSFMLELSCCCCCCCCSFCLICSTTCSIGLNGSPFSDGSSSSFSSLLFLSSSSAVDS